MNPPPRFVNLSKNMASTLLVGTGKTKGEDFTTMGRLLVFSLARKEGAVDSDSEDSEVEDVVPIGGLSKEAGVGAGEDAVDLLPEMGKEPVFVKKMKGPVTAMCWMKVWQENRRATAAGLSSLGGVMAEKWG